MSRIVEQVMYIGPRTAMAEELRCQDLDKMIITFARVLLGLLPDAIAQTPDGTRMARGVLSGLGYDPDECTLSRKLKPWPGFVVRDTVGQPVQFITLKSFRELAGDRLFVDGFTMEAGHE